MINKRNHLHALILSTYILLLLMLPGKTMANDLNKWNGTVLGFENASEGMLGDMLGIRPILNNNGFNFRLAFMTQSAWNTSGGYNTDTKHAYVDDTAFTFRQDLERFTDIPDAAIEGNIVNRNHNDNLTVLRTTDPRVSPNDQAQEGYTGQSITRLGWLTFSRSFMERRLNWRIGMMNKNQDFDQTIPCDFQMLTQCGGKSAGSFTWYNWNSHYWGTTLQYKITPEVTFKTGILEQNSRSTQRSHAWSWSTKGSKGFLLPVEIEWKTNDIGGMPGAYNLAFLFTNAEQNDLYERKTQTSSFDASEDYKKHNRTWYMYSGFNQQITKHDDDSLRGMSISGSVSISDQRSNFIHQSWALSARYRGPFNIRPNDWIGVGASYINTSNHYKKNQEYQNRINGTSDYTSPMYSPVPGDSFNIDLYYRVQATPWFSLQPDLQYWHRPGGVSQTQDAWVVGLKTMMIF